MKPNYVLIDYENVQPKDLGLLRDGTFIVKLFLGRDQAKIPVELASALQALGQNAQYIQLKSVGANALDFHIAYYLGDLSSKDPTASYHIISKDTGFDPLIAHLKAKGVSCHRCTSIAALPALKPAKPSAPVQKPPRPAIPSNNEALLKQAVMHLERVKNSKPRTQKTLSSSLHSLFRKELSEEQLSTLLGTLYERGIVKVDGNKVTYEMPLGLFVVGSDR